MKVTTLMMTLLSRSVQDGSIVCGTGAIVLDSKGQGMRINILTIKNMAMAVSQSQNKHTSDNSSPSHRLAHDNFSRL